MAAASEVRYGQKRRQCSAGENASFFYSTKAAQYARKGDVKSAFLQAQGTGQDVELVAGPVAELTEHFLISRD